MTKLEKSIRHELACYGSGLRSGCYGYIGMTGLIPSRGIIQDAYVHIGEDGLCKFITLYTSSGVREDEYYLWDGVIPINDLVTRYLSGNDTWDDFVETIVERVIAYKNGEWNANDDM